MILNREKTWIDALNSLEIEETNKDFIDEITISETGLSKRQTNRIVGKYLAILTTTEAIDTAVKKYYRWLKDRSTTNSIQLDLINLYKDIEIYVGKDPKHHAVCRIKALANIARRERGQKEREQKTKKLI
ncbi:hypothetical protein WKK05_36230 (plasmid) [Nostoc sp. UHCC 0302]|uniref:hypothetical protein n=1 Tax=Nostoc sp. UHCC 0302 TaxID=3134896 RepID=UPI00311CBF9C